VQREEQFRFALPSSSLTDAEAEVSRVAQAFWRAQWRRLSPEDGEPRRVGMTFVEALSGLRRQNSSSADRFSMVARLLAPGDPDVAATSAERFSQLTEAVRRLQGNGRLLVIVGNTRDSAFVSEQLAGAARGIETVAVARDLPRMSVRADCCIVCGYYGSCTLDGILRARPSSITWIVDPVEAGAAGSQLHFQAAVLSRLGLDTCADIVGSFAAALTTASGGQRRYGQAEATTSHLPEIALATATDDWNQSTNIEQVDRNPDLILVLSDGTELSVSDGRRFDVVRPGAPFARTLPSSELEEGDRVLLVRGTYQRTLSELLLEDMDRAELHDEARLRDTWIQMVSAAVSHSRLSNAAIAARLKTAGVPVSYQRIRSWLGLGAADTTPRDWLTFAAFAASIGITLPESDLRQFFMAIKRWRVGHRIRGRQVVRLLRLAWFGGLSASTLGQIEERWSLGVRDLIEGSRVEEVEEIRRLGN